VAATTRTERRTAAAVLLAASVTLFGGCADKPPPAAPAAPTNHQRFAHTSLLDYVPAAGLRWLVVGRPNRLSAEPELASATGLVFSPERLDAFAEVTGIRLERLPMGVIAGYDLGTLYLAEIEGLEAPIVRARFSARLVEGGIVHERAGLHRIVGTTASGAVRALVTVDDRSVAFASGDASLARIVEAYARKHLRSPTALRGAALSLLPPLSDDTLVAFLAPGPFSNEWGGAAGGVLAATLAVSIEARMAAQGRLHATLTLAGAWGAGADTVEDAVQKLELAWSDLQKSPTGHLLGLDQASGHKASGNLQHLTLSTDLPVGPLARGLRDATSADVREILELDGPRSGSPP
jgi:hypothetical protein